MKNTTDRKKDHIDLAFESKTDSFTNDNRFFYEPMLTTHPPSGSIIEHYFLGKALSAPIWISSMTGGTGIAQKINSNLARACKDFGLGMGLGSCRKILTSNEYFADFDVRKLIGDQPLFANLGIAQVTELIECDAVDKIKEMVKRLQADGLIIHVNPVQEWMQPEGDSIVKYSPLDSIKYILDKTNLKLIIKEVGQGIGPESLKELLMLPIAALEFGAYGGTNFAKLEHLRDKSTNEVDPICFVGHTSSEMISFIHTIAQDFDIVCKDFIISGGIKNYLDGYYFNESLSFNSVYGQAAGFLKYAQGEYDILANYVNKQISGYKFAMRYLRLRD